MNNFSLVASLLASLVVAPDAEVPKKSRAWKFGMDKIFTPFYMNLMVSDKEKMREIVSQILEVRLDALTPSLPVKITRARTIVQDAPPSLDNAIILIPS
jgi:hypothetical protein